MSKDIKTPDFKSTRIKTDKEYFYHIIGSDASFRYDIEEQELQCFVFNNIVERYNKKMTFAEFVSACRKIFLETIKIDWGLN